MDKGSKVNDQGTSKVFTEFVLVFLLLSFNKCSCEEHNLKIKQTKLIQVRKEISDDNNHNNDSNDNNNNNNNNNNNKLLPTCCNLVSSKKFQKIRSILQPNLNIINESDNNKIKNNNNTFFEK